jgi:hypothetical protein
VRLLTQLSGSWKSWKPIDEAARPAWATLQRLRKFLEANGARIATPEDRTFESEGQAIESGLRRTIEGRDMVMRSLVQVVYRFRDATLVAEKKDDFGNSQKSYFPEPLEIDPCRSSTFNPCLAR